MIDRQHIGYTSPPFTTEVERGRLRYFAQALEARDQRGELKAAGDAQIALPA